MSKTARLWIRKAAFFLGYFSRATRATVQPVGRNQQLSPVQSRADPRPSIGQKLARVMQSRGAISQHPNTQSHEDSEQSAALNSYLHNDNEVYKDCHH